jgi:N-acetylneuraminic acid mutarotase
MSDSKPKVSPRIAHDDYRATLIAIGRGQLMTKFLAALSGLLLLSACSGGGANRPCVPGQSISCVGAGNCPGVQICSLDGSRYEPCVCSFAPTGGGSTGGGAGGGGTGGGAGDGGLLDGGYCMPPEPAVAGTFRTSVVDVQFTSVSASIAHKVDVDAQEDGCIARVVLQFGSPTVGCSLKLTFGGVDVGRGALAEAVFRADSLCPGFPDNTEGYYQLPPGYGPWWYTGPTRVLPPMAAQACVAGTIAFPDRPFRLRRSDGAEMLVNLKDLSATGNFYSRGNQGLTCLTSGSCAGLFHDDGTGWCVSSGCASGFHDGGAGLCVPVGTCSVGYHDGGSGACVAQGTCSIGYHDGGTGACVDNSTCSPGFHNGGDGSCVGVGSCSSGFHDGGSGSCVAVGTCSAGYHDGGAGSCVVNGTCSPGFWLEGSGRCVLWTSTGPMTTSRSNCSATLLPNGRVLVISGRSPTGTTATVESYDPASNTWSVVGAILLGRWNHTATLLPNGKVLIAGGYATSGPTANAELYDPATNVRTSAGTMSSARYNHTATLLPNGSVLVVGGSDGSSSLGGGALGSADLYNPSTNTWSSAAAMSQPRLSHTATVLADGRVLVAGGSGVSGLMSAADLYDPVSNAWTSTGSMTTWRYVHAAARLTNGEVFVVGGSSTVVTPEIYNPASGTWRAGAAMTAARPTPLAVTLSSGKVLVVGGAGNAAALYDSSTDTWTMAGTANGAATATLLPSGRVLVTGGAQAQLYVGN